MTEALVRTTINGRPIEARLPTRMLLVEFLRDRLGLTGTKVSCGMQVCGACTVFVDERPVSACGFLACDIDGADVVTIEGLAPKDGLTPVQQAFVDCSALQCGFCTPGFVMMSTALLRKTPNPTEEQVAHYLDGNLCRCTGYEPIVEAVLHAAEAISAAEKGPDDE
jgi:aerobic-type carbon monoxide dehydrogenase small subunit (CoxS/CutS family)